MNNMNPIDTVEALPGISEEYAHLFDQDHYVRIIKLQDVNAILLMVCEKDREIQFGRKVVYFNGRAFQQLNLDEISQEKVKVHLKKDGFYFQCGSVAFNILSGFFGGGMQGGKWGAIFYSLGHSFEYGAGHHQKISDAETEGLQHRGKYFTDRMSQTTQDETRTDQDHDKILERLIRLAQDRFHQTQSIFGG